MTEEIDTKAERKKHLEEIKNAIKKDRLKEMNVLVTLSTKQILRELFIYVSHKLAGLEQYRRDNEIFDNKKGEPAEFWAKYTILQKVQKYLMAIDDKDKFLFKVLD